MLTEGPGEAESHQKVVEPGTTWRHLKNYHHFSVFRATFPDLKLKILLIILMTELKTLFMQRAYRYVKQTLTFYLEDTRYVENQYCQYALENNMLKRELPNNSIL